MKEETINQLDTVLSTLAIFVRGVASRTSDIQPEANALSTEIDKLRDQLQNEEIT